MSKQFEYCIPTYNGEDNWKTVEGWSAEYAARCAARYYNEDGDYALSNDRVEYVLIREKEGSPIQIFVMSAEPSIEYHATEKTEIKCLNCGANLREKVIKGMAYTRDEKDYCDYACRQQWYDKWYAEYRAKNGLDQ
jgi:hypothetical protein